MSQFSPVQVLIVNDTDCRAKMSDNMTITDSMVCAGGEGRAPCHVSYWCDMDVMLYPRRVTAAAH
jgi:hypothetical protein